MTCTSYTEVTRVEVIASPILLFTMASVPYISKPLVEELFISRSSSLNKLEGSWWLRVWLRGRVWLRDRVWLLDSDWWKGRLIIIELLKERLTMSLEIVHCQIKQDNIMTIEQMPVILFKSRDCLAPTLECTVEVCTTDCHTFVMTFLTLGGKTWKDLKPQSTHNIRTACTVLILIALLPLVQEALGISDFSAALGMPGSR